MNLNHEKRSLKLKNQKHIKSPRKKKVFNIIINLRLRELRSQEGGEGKGYVCEGERVMPSLVATAIVAVQRVGRVDTKEKGTSFRGRSTLVLGR